MNLDRLESALRQYDLDLLIASTPANVAYLTGFRPPFEIGAAAHQTFVILPKDPEDIVLIIPQADIANYCTSDLRVNEIETYGRCFQYTGEKLGGVEARVIRLYEQSVKDAYETAVQALIGGLQKRGWHHCRIGIDELHLSPEMLNQINSELPRAPIRYANRIFAEIRAVKTDSEIRRIKEATRLAGGALSAAIASLKPGRREIELVSIMKSYLSAQNAVPILWYAGVGRWSSLIDREPLPHAVVESGDWVMLDVGCRYNNYYADLARSVVLDPANHRQKQYYRAIEQGRQQAIEAIRPGVSSADIFKIAIKTIRSEGIPHFDRAHIGHGIGCDFYELPSLCADDLMTIESGMVINVETPYYEIGWGGIQLEDTLVVREDGVEFLSDLPVALNVL